MHADLFDHVTVKRMALQPGDIVVLKPERPLSNEQGEELRATAKMRFPDHEVIVLNGIDLEIRRNA
jgi:hypothetical protein